MASMKKPKEKPSKIPEVESRIQHYKWLAKRKIELFSVQHEFMDDVLRRVGVKVPA